MILSRKLRLLLAASLLVALACLAAACRNDGGGWNAQGTERAFGNGYKDVSEIIARANGVEITRNDLDRYYEELPDKVKRQYTGEGWEKRLLRRMIDDALMFQEAQRRRLDRDPKVAQTIISTRRILLIQALRESDLVKDLRPSDAEIREHYERNQTAYMQAGMMQARHIHCKDQQTAQLVHDELLRAKNQNWEFTHLVAKYSLNAESAKLAGDLGWFNRGGYIPALAIHGKQFSEMVWDWPVGLHAPVKIGGDWHVVEILRRQPDRMLSVDEARDQIITELMPMLKQQKIEEFLREARSAADINYYGNYAPGGGMNPRDLLQIAQMGKPADEQIALYNQVLEEFGDSEYADDALFLLGNVYLDAWGDTSFSSRYLLQLLREHPDSEYAEQARYILDNMRKPGFRQPKSADDLKSTGQ